MTSNKSSGTEHRSSHVDEDQHTDETVEHPSRRGFLGQAAVGLAGATAATAGLFSGTDAQAKWKHSDSDWNNWRDPHWNDHERDRHRACPSSGNPKDRLVLKNGIVLSLDPKVGDFQKANVLVEGKKIIAIGPDVQGSGQVIDCDGMIVMPGFINTHHHQFYAPQRADIADGNILPTDAWPQEAYATVAGLIWTTGQLTVNGKVIWDLGRSPYDPEDCYISQLITSVNQIDQGVTTGVDTSQCCHTPEYTDAMIAGIMDSGRRTLFAYWSGRTDQPGYEYPGKIGDTTKGIGRLRKQYFSSSDQLVTLGLSGSSVPDTLAVARSFGAPIVSHTGKYTDVEAAFQAHLLKSDQIIIHAAPYPDDVIAHIGQAGAHLSLAVPIEMQMGHGIPVVQKALDAGILPSLSSDVETNMTPNMFTIMRTAFTLQRMNIHTRNRNGETNVPPLLTCYQTLQMGTLAGAAAAQLSNKVGTLTPGKEADIIVLDARHALNTAGFNNAPGAVVTLMDPGNVKHVLIAGAIKKWNGNVVGVNIDDLTRKVERSRDRILGRIKSKPIPVDGLNSAPGYTPKFFGSCCVSQLYNDVP